MRRLVRLKEPTNLPSCRLKMRRLVGPNEVVSRTLGVGNESFSESP